MDEKWHMVFDHIAESWSWCVSRGRMTQWATAIFSRYVDAYEDAKLHGCVGLPLVVKLNDFESARASNCLDC